MARSRVSCPECDAPLALDLSALADKKVRCPKCEAIFAPGAIVNEGIEVVEEPTRPKRTVDRPRRFKAKRQSASPVALIVMIVGSAVLLAGAGVGGYMLFKKKSGAHKDVVPPEGIGINVGQLAKEIEGEDIHGVSFKLSDYRGKVVLLDFWGHW